MKKNAEKKDEKFVKVKATHMGYYDHKRRYEGDEFAMTEEAYYKTDKKGNRIKKVDEDGDEVYEVASWVELLESDFDPHKVAPVPEKKNLVNKPLVTPVAPVAPKSGNPIGFAPTPAPATTSGKPAAAKPEEKHMPGTPTAATHSNQGDDVI